MVTPLRAPQVPLREGRATLRCPVCRFRETTFELLGGVTELNFNQLNLGDDEAVQLAVVLPLCAKLTKLKLMNTKLGDKGAAALAGAIKGNGVVKTLFLANNQIGAAGAAAFADALRVNGVLEQLYLGLTRSATRAPPPSPTRSASTARCRFWI